VLAGTPQRLDHAVGIVERLLQVVERAVSHARHRRVHAGVSRHHDHLGVGAPGADLLDEVLSGRVAQHQIEEHDLHPLLELREHPVSVVRLEHFVRLALREAPKHPNDRRLVIRDQDAGSRARGSEG
jgi:hypothetical protein